MDSWAGNTEESTVELGTAEHTLPPLNFTVTECKDSKLRLLL